jgi:hypothetical protein
VRRFILFFVALFVLVSATTSFAEAEKKAKAKKRSGKKIHKTHKMAKGEATGPFADVPKGHWAYDAVQKSAESGILQGWDNRFHGNKIVNRYQMAVVVARMLDRVGVLKANGKVITAQDIANLESLTIEFADELALLNVKVSTLEDTVAGLKKDVDLIKADLRGVGARAGITGALQTRFAFTDDGQHQWHAGDYRFQNGVAATGAARNGATTPITRYRGSPVTGTGAATNAYAYSDRNFFTVSNFAINIDREFDPKIHFHSQLNVNAEGGINNVMGTGFLAGGAPSVYGGFAPQAFDPFLTGTLPLASGRGSNFAAGAPGGAIFSTEIMVNEAYVVFDDWFTDGVNGRLGVFALPMNTEVNGPSRSYQWTVTPSIANSKWESLRPVGLDIFQHNDKDELVFYVGFFTPHDLVLGVPRSGTLLMAPTGFGFNPIAGAAGALNGSTVANVQNDTLAGPAFGGAAQVGRFPTPLAFAAMTDAPFGTSTSTAYDSDNPGFYGMVGTHPTNKQHTGFNWHVAYFDRNGDIRATSTNHMTLTDWYAWQLAASYQWEKVYVGAQYYDARSKNYSFADLATPAAAGAYNRRGLTTPFANVLGGDTRSDSFMGIVNWQFNKRGSLTARYENAEDKTGAARIEADVWTFAFNYKTSDHGWFQLEWIDPTTRATSENGIQNRQDVNDDLVQVNYKLNW